MASRTTVNISITPELGAFLQSRVASGRYQTTSEVVREALRLLEREELGRSQAIASLKAKLDQGIAEAARGELLDGDAVFAELKSLIAGQTGAKSRRPAVGRRSKT
jgi:antitoxin ParD1/3/4